MTHAMTLSETLLRNAIGYDPLQRFAEMVATTSYPPHNIEKLDDDRYRLTLAVAGFAREEIEITLQKGILIVTGAKSTDAADRPAFLYQGIAFRDFSRQFKLGEHVEVTAATLKDGLLVIDLERKLPEEQKARLIAIR